MKLRRRRQTTDSRNGNNLQNGGLFVHHNPPSLIPLHPSIIRQWLRSGEIDKLEQIVLEGQGHKLLGEHSPDPNVRRFLKAVPAYLARIDMLHESVSRGRLLDLQTLLNMDPDSNYHNDSFTFMTSSRMSRIRGGGELVGAGKRHKLKKGTQDLVLCRDHSGAGLLHKAVFYNHPDITKWLSKNYPLTMVIRDKEKRTALHYCGLCEEPSEMWGILVSNGADTTVVDSRGHTPAYYMDHPDEIDLPATTNNSKFNTYSATNRELVVKPANIRIWIHDRDLKRLQQVLWEGQGDRLRMETSHHPVIRKFLNAVPFIMGTIKEVHSAAINNDLFMLKKYSQDPIPRDILRSKDASGLTPLHKAAGLGNIEIVNEILLKCPEALNVQDKEGRTALHFAAALRDNGEMYRTLKEAGALEDITDKKGKPAGYYQVRPKELLDSEDFKLLSQAPDAPRTASIHPTSWDWKILHTDCDSGSSAYYSNNNNNNPQPSVNGDSAFEDMGIEEPTADPSQRFIENERIRNQVLPQNTNMVNEDDIDEGVGAEPDERMNHLDRDNNDNIVSDSDREYEEVEPHQHPPDNPVLNDYKANEVIKDPKPTARTVDNRINNKNLEQNESEDYEEDNDEDSDDNVRNNKNIVNDKVLSNDNNPSLERRSGNWRNITTRNQSPPRYSQSQAYQQQHVSTNHLSRPFDIGSPFNRPRTVTVDRKNDHSVGDNDDKNIENEVRDIVDNGDLEGMADLVLSGHGDKLLSCRSRLPDVQMFIDNVPTYMAKIKAVHAYTREGNLRGVQTALDRRKFAVSRERGGLTPLHEAVLYGRAAVLRYLAARFPETLHARDHHGRTALHYAATLPDNAHFYNVLLTLGADKDALDEYGKAPEHYLKNPGDLTHSQLLDEFEKGTQSEFGPYYTRPLNNHIDQVQFYNSGNHPNNIDNSNNINNNTDNNPKIHNPTNGYINPNLIPNGNPGHVRTSRPDLITNAAVIQEGFPVFGAEDGQYLASSLGDPLIKGLTEVASVRPPQPIVYLANYLLDYDRSSNINVDNNHNDKGWRSPDKEPDKAVIPRSTATSAAKPRPVSSKSKHFDDNFDSIENNINNFDMNKDDSDDNDEITSVEVIDDGNVVDANHGNFFMNGVSGERRDSQNQLSMLVEGQESSFKPIQRDDHGQSTLHFAASRTHGRNGLYQLLTDMDSSIALRDELYRTARDVAMQINLPENVIAIDRFVVYLAANGSTDKLQELLLEGYDHILDTTDDQQGIVEITAKRGHQTTLALLQTIATFEERRDRLHRVIRSGNSTQVQEMIRYGNGPQLAVAKNLHSRCSLHIAVLCQHESIVDHIATRYPQTLQIGDNLMRMPLHYAMGVDKVEILSRILIRAGAQRIVKDLKGRQPSYYFMNKSEIQQLQDEEDLLRQ